MHIPRGTLIAFMVFAPAMIYGQPGAPAPSTPTAATPPTTPSSVLQPALSNMESTLTSLKIDKWKRGSIREECGDNVNDILKDLKTNLPPLMADADSAPSALSKSIPLMKHVDALYDVLLRIEEGARVSAPADQVDQLESALKQFGIARIQLYDSMAQQAAVHEKHIADLQATIKAQQVAAEEHKAAPAAAPVPCTPPKPAAKRRHVAPKTTPPAATQKPPAQTKPQ